jgi:acetylglutamate kinase
LKIVTMVYAGWINKDIVAKLNARDCTSLGISGADAQTILAHKRKHTDIDYGFVGDIDQVNSKALMALLSQGISIVVAPITQDSGGQLLNTNADTIAQELAKAMSVHFSTSLIYSFEKKGVMKDVSDEGSVIAEMDASMFKQMKEDQTIFAGMIPKLDNAFAAIEAGVSKVIIGDALELAALIEGKSGTTIR